MPSWLSLTVATGDLPSLMIVSVVVPSPFRTEILWVPFCSSVIVTFGDLPSRTVVSVVTPSGFVITIV